MVLILAAMMAFGSIAGTMDTGPLEGETDVTQVFWKGNVILAIGQDPEDVRVQVYNNEDRLIAACWCDVNYHFEVSAPDGNRYVTNGVYIVLTNYNTIDEHTRTHTVGDWPDDYFWVTNPNRWVHGCGTLNFTIIPVPF